MSILDDSTEDHIASSGFIPGTQFTRTKTVSLLDQIKEREREEKLENLFESGALYSSSKKDEDDVDELLEIFGGEEDARFEDDDDDDVERKQEEEEDAREIFDADGKNSSGRLILKVDADRSRCALS